MTNETLKLLNQKPVAYYPIYRKLTGSATGGILLSQLMYWFSACQSDKFYKTDNDIKLETGLSDSELRTSKDKIRKLDFITISREGVPAKTYYEIDWEVYKTSLDKSTNPVLLNPTNCNSELPQTSSEESTKLLQENTSENKQENTYSQSSSKDDVIYPQEQSMARVVDDDLEKLFNGMQKYKCNFKTSEELLSNARKTFIDISDNEIIKALIQSWKFYKPNSKWETGAWIFREFFPEAYRKLAADKAEEKRLAEYQKQQKVKRQAEQRQAHVETTACEKTFRIFKTFPEDKKMNWIKEFNKLHLFDGKYIAKVEYRNKTFQGAVTKFDLDVFKIFLNKNLRVKS